MYVTCLDLEGVLVPEIWIAFAEEVRIPELRVTTREMPDYDALMLQRIRILAERGLKLSDVQSTIARVKPLEGALAFLDELRQLCQVIILSDTFTQFALPLMRQLGMPTIFCNNLEIDRNGAITGYKLRQQNGKYHAVRALKSIGFQTIAAGDSYNDLAMIHEADRGFLFRSTAAIIRDNPGIAAFTEYADFLGAIKNQLSF